MLATVEDVHHRHRHAECSSAIELGDVLVQRDLAGRRRGLGHGQGYRENGVGAKVRLVVSAIGFDHGRVQLALLRRVAPQQQFPDGAIDVPDRLQYTLAEVALAVAIAQLQRLPGAGRGTGGRAGHTDCAAGQGHLGHDRRIAAGIHDFKGLYVGNLAHCVNSSRQIVIR